MIAIFDEDGGGDVDFQEFVSGLSAFSSKGNKEEKLRFAFRVYDIDRDGYISNGELFIVLKMMVGSNLKDQQLQQVRPIHIGSYIAETSNKHIDCRQDHHGGRSRPRRQDQLRGVHKDGREHRRFYEHDPGPILSAFSITNATASPGTRVSLARRSWCCGHTRERARQYSIFLNSDPTSLVNTVSQTWMLARIMTDQH